MFPKSFLTLLIFLIFFGHLTYGRVINDQLSSDLVSNGSTNNNNNGHEQQGGVIRLFGSAAAIEESCEQSYGFLPCTKTTLGNLFLILVYGYLMFLAATYLSSGSELLLEILGPGLIGGLFLPMLALQQKWPMATLIFGNVSKV